MVFQWYIKASIHVSLCLLALVWFTGIIFGIPVDKVFLWALFFGSIAGYNAIKYGRDPREVKLWKQGARRPLLITSFLSLLLALYFTHLLPLRTIGLITLAVVLSGLYVIPLRPGGANLRSFGFLKVFLVALVWTILTVWAPTQLIWRELRWDIAIESIQRLLWVFLLMIPFEIRDMKSDPPGLRSFPQRYGLDRTRKISWGVIVLFTLMTFLKDAPVSGEILCKILIGLLMGLSISRAKEIQPPYYASFWVEGIPLAAVGFISLFQF